VASGLFFCAHRSFGTGFFHHELHVLRHQFLDLTVAVDGGLEVGHLFRGHVAGNIAAVFIALVIIVGPLRALAQHADGATIQTLDLGDVVEERLRSQFWIHGWKYMCMAYTKATKKAR
jgi:hypothetical protein